MDVAGIAFVTATTAFVSAVVGPLVTFVISTRQIRATVISNNRERWLESLRDSIAEYVGLLLTAAMVKASKQDAESAIAGDHDLRESVERLVLVKHKIALMVSPSERRNDKLLEAIDTSYQCLLLDAAPDLTSVRSDVAAITHAGRVVLRAEWARVKRGE